MKAFTDERNLDLISRLLLSPPVHRVFFGKRARKMGMRGEIENRGKAYLEAQVRKKGGGVDRDRYSLII